MMDDLDGVRTAIRQRPGMYIGSSQWGRQHLALEVIGNAVDLVLAGLAREIHVVLHEDGSIEISDDGPGIDLQDDAARRRFRQLHLTATADGHYPHIHLAWPGSGLAAVTSLSAKLIAVSTRAGTTTTVAWRDGGLHEEVKSESSPAGATGTSIRFWPDSSVLGDGAIAGRDLQGRISELNALIPEMDLSLSWPDSSYSPAQGRTWEDGLSVLLDGLDMPARGFFDSNRRAHFRGAIHDEAVEIATELTLGVSRRNDEDERLALWCNYTPITQESGFQKAIRSAFWQHAPDPADQPNRPLRGLSIAASLTMLDPTFGGPTRGRIDDPRATSAVTWILEQQLPAGPEAIFSSLR